MNRIVILGALLAVVEWTGGCAVEVDDVGVVRAASGAATGTCRCKATWSEPDFDTSERVYNSSSCENEWFLMQTMVTEQQCSTWNGETMRDFDITIAGTHVAHWKALFGCRAMGPDLNRNRDTYVYSDCRLD